MRSRTPSARSPGTRRRCRCRPHRRRRACRVADRPLRYRGRAAHDRVGARRERASSADCGRAVGASGPTRVPRALRGDATALHLPAAQSRGAARPHGGARRLVPSPARRRRHAASFRNVDRHARFLVVSCRGVSGEVAGQDARARACRARGPSRAIRFFRQRIPPSHGPQHRRRAGDRGVGQGGTVVDGRAAGRARPHARSRDVRAGRPLLLRRGLRCAIRRCRRRGARLSVPT